jgi:uncharacterized membrane protein
MAGSSKTPPPASAFQSIHRIIFLVFLLSFGAIFTLITSGSSSPAFYPLLVMLVLSAVATTLLSISQSLPVQNALTIAILIGLLSTVVEITNLKTNLPFGHHVWGNNLGPQLFHLVPWPVPLIWIIVILNSRGFARLLLRPCRNFPNYGLFCLALASLLAAVLDLGLEHFAAVNHFWAWPESKVAPWYNFLSYALTSAIVLFLITPWLINKKPIPQSPPDYHPLAVWLLLQLLFVVNR